MSRLSISIALVAAVQALAPLTASASCDNSKPDLGPSRCEGLASMVETSGPTSYTGNAHQNERGDIVTMDMDAAGVNDTEMYYVPDMGLLQQYEIADGKAEISSRTIYRGLNSPVEVTVNFGEAASKEFSEIPRTMIDALFIDTSVDQSNQDVPVINAEMASFNGKVLKMEMSPQEYGKFQSSKGVIVSDPSGMK